MQPKTLRCCTGGGTTAEGMSPMSPADLAELDAMLHPTTPGEAPDPFAADIRARRRQLGLVALGSDTDAVELDAHGVPDPFAAAIVQRRHELGLD